MARIARSEPVLIVTEQFIVVNNFMQSINPQLDPGPILQTAFAFWSSKVLLTAVEFDVFTKLGNRRMTGAKLGLHSRGISDFFDALVAMQFLDRARA